MCHVYVRADNLAGVLISDDEYPHRVAHTLLTKVSRIFFGYKFKYLYYFISSTKGFNRFRLYNNFILTKIFTTVKMNEICSLQTILFFSTEIF